MPKAATAHSLIEAGLSRSYAYHVMAGTRTLPVPVALWLLDTKGLVAPALEGKTKREIDVLRGMFEPAPPKPVSREVELHRASAA